MISFFWALKVDLIDCFVCVFCDCDCDYDWCEKGWLSGTVKGGREGCRGVRRWRWCWARFGK
jgi:hypothetical protein